jgi:hypothetical protein
MTTEISKVEARAEAAVADEAQQRLWQRKRIDSFILLSGSGLDGGLDVGSYRICGNGETIR